MFLLYLNNDGFRDYVRT